MLRKVTLNVFAMLLLNISIAVCQTTDTALYEVIYDVYHIDDTTKKDKPSVTEDMVLYIGMQGSLYRQLMDEEYRPLLHQSKGGSMATFDILEESSAVIHLDSKVVEIQRVFDNMYNVTQDVADIPWELSDKSKEIGGYIVQKATAAFRGREYTVWFTPEIPFPYGPWKLQGLPGLILEAYDSKEEVRFTFKGFGKVERDTSIKIAVPKGSKIKKINTKELHEIHMAVDKDPIGFMAASLGVSPSQISGGNSDNERPKIRNNPIELIED